MRFALFKVHFVYYHTTSQPKHELSSAFSHLLQNFWRNNHNYNNAELVQRLNITPECYPVSPSEDHLNINIVPLFGGMKTLSDV